jgi:hypothetical protein
VFLWGVASGHRIALCSAALAAAKGLQVAVIDADTAFQATSPVATVKACRVPPGSLLRPVTIARAFTCRQVVTLATERLTPLLAREPIALIVLLGSLMRFRWLKAPATASPERMRGC